ncbi:unnamed protein product [Lota lota]
MRLLPPSHISPLQKCRSRLTFSSPRRRPTTGGPSVPGNARGVSGHSPSFPFLPLLLGDSDPHRTSVVSAPHSHADAPVLYTRGRQCHPRNI